MLGVPGIDIGLPALPDGTSSSGERCEEGASLGGFLLGVVGLGASQRSLLRLGPPLRRLGVLSPGQTVVTGCAGLGGQRDELLVGVGGAGEEGPVEGELAGDRMVQGLLTRARDGDVNAGWPKGSPPSTTGQVSAESVSSGRRGGRWGSALGVAVRSPSRASSR